MAPVRAAAAHARRSYVYYLSERGSLFHVFDVRGLLTGRAIPGGPTFLSDPKFLDFFFRRVEYNHVGHVYQIAAATATGPCSAASRLTGAPPLAELHSPEFLLRPSCTLGDGTCLSPLEMLLHFPYVSPCGPELNFIKAQDGVPVVFTSLSVGQRSSEGVGGAGEASAEAGPQAVLRFAGTLSQAFDPDSIVVSDDGKLFHAVRGMRGLADPRVSPSRPAAECGADAAAPLAALLAPLSSVDLAESAALRSALETAGGSGTLSTLPRPPTDEDMRTLLARVRRPPRGLLGAAVGLQLGMEYMCDDGDAAREEGRFTMMWDGRRRALPLW